MVPLYDSTICRLCAGDNGNEHLFVREEGGSDLCSLVNRYLPLKVQDDGKLPRTICPGCTIQLEATVEFFDLVVTGQHKLRTLFKYQNEQQRKAERLRNKSENAELARENANNDSLQQNEEFEQQIIVQILPDGSMYAAEHEMSLQMEGLTKPRRKRGRPPKALAEAESLATKENATETASQGEEDKQEEEIDEVDGDGRRRRKRKVPKRFSEAVQGKELERIFKEEGVIGEEDYDDSDMLDDSEDLLNISAQDEVIGHLETEEGKDLGEVVISHRAKARSRSKSYRRKPRFICHVCGRGFLQRSKFIMHNKVFHKDFLDAKDNPETQQTSKLAEGNVAESQEPSGHVETEQNAEQDASAAVTDDANLGDATYRCDKCEKQFESKQECEVHQRMEHDQQKLYTCNVCDKTFINQSNMKIHMGLHEKTKPVYSCDVCDKVLNHPSSIVYHKEAEHNDGRRFVCNKCNKGFKHRQLLQRHQLVHSNDRPHICKSCNACFKTKANLINHQATHTGQKKHFCEICSQQFAHKTSLTLHYRWHNGQKPYECKVCHKSFSQNGNLQEHMRIHTGEKPYCCDYCGRKFTTSSQFKLHVKRHTGERPWKCEFCVKTFLHKDTWKCHVRRHKGERPFQCPQCNRGFTEQWALRKHVRSHTGEKPYSCKICGKAFADCSNLAKHKKVHKAKEADGSENSPIGEVWQIMPNSQENDEQALDGQMTQVIATDETSTDGVQQIIYVSYQDPDETNPSRTLHFVDASMIKNKSEETPSAISLPQLSEAAESLPDKVVNNATNGNEQQSEIEPNLHLQITHDDDGNPISLSVQETRQLVSQGHLISQLSDGQFVRVHPGMFTQFQALNIHIDEDDVAAEGSTAAREPNAAKAIEGMSTIQADAEAIVQALEDESTDATMVATINQLQSGEQPGIADGQHSSIEFLTADGQKIRVLSSYPIDPMQLTSEYLTIMNDMEHARLNTLNVSWPTCLAIRGNLLPSKIPHIPILVEKISRYVSLPGYEENRVKTVQTIGEIIPGSARICELRSVSPDCEATVTLSLERLPVNVVYLTDQQGRRLPIWEKYRVFKVYGTLERKDNKVILIADRLLKVQDLYGSLNTLTLLSRVAHPMYYQRNCVALIKHLTHNRSMNVFTQCLNPLTGVDTWQEQDEHYDYHQEVARSSFADMLHDKERNEKYYIALKNAIEKIHRTGKEANVLDIGTGTGLLAMMAAKCGADTITACEAFTPMANCAAQIIEENGFADKIKLIRKRSTKMTVGKDSDMPKRANILVTEVFDTELIGEGALLTFRHAHEALLEKDCIVIPHSGTVWVQVVESSKVNAWNRVKPIKIEEDLTLDPPSAVQACSGAAAVHDMQLSRLPRDCFVALLPPQPIFRFDWSNEESLKYKDQVVLQVQSIACGTAHAIFMWWDLNMDTENRIVLSCAPVWEHPDVSDIVKSQKNTSRLLKMADSIPWRDHWMQAVYYLPKEVLIKPNEDISLIGYHDEYSFWFKLLNKSIKDVPDCPRPICSCDMHIAYSRTRIGQLNDKVRNDKYIKALRNVKKDVCLCFSDGCLPALALAKSGSKVFLLEQNFLSRKTMEKFVEANELSERVTFIDSIDDLPEGICNDLDLIFGEPYFLSSILPWENLRFWYLAYKFPEHIRRMPYAATIRGLFVEFKDLHKIRAPLGVCEGFDLSSFDELVQNSSEKSDSPIEAQPLWEYSCKALSKPFDIARFDLSRIINLDEHMRLDGAVPIEEDGLCNGVALWVDWNLHLNCKPVSCGPIDEVIPGGHVSWDPYTRQGVHLFRNVSRVTRNSLFWWSFSFGIRHGEMKFDFSEVVKD